MYFNAGKTTYKSYQVLNLYTLCVLTWKLAIDQNYKYLVKTFVTKDSVSPPKVYNPRTLIRQFYTRHALQWSKLFRLKCNDQITGHAIYIIDHRWFSYMLLVHRGGNQISGLSFTGSLRSKFNVKQASLALCRSLETWLALIVIYIFTNKVMTSWMSEASRKGIIIIGPDVPPLVHWCNHTMSFLPYILSNTNKWLRKVLHFHTTGTIEFLFPKNEPFLFLTQQSDLHWMNGLIGLSFVLAAESLESFSRSGEWDLEETQIKLKPCEIFTTTLIHFMHSAGKQTSRASCSGA